MYLLKLFTQNAAQAIRNAELNEALMQKEKLSAVGQVIGMVIHDLRSPLSTIKQTINLMKEEDYPGDLIGLIDQSLDNASLIFDDLLDFIKENPVRKVPVSLNKIVNVAIKQAETRRGFGKVDFVQDIPEGLVIPGDESKLERVLVNLLNNAVDALADIPGKGIVHIITQTDSKEVVLHITDDGPGIPPEINKTLFDPFVTLHKKNGTGLGLAIVAKFVAMHGGTISVTNDPGANFKISLPLY
jgi:signal transduction histidine kinase